MLLQKNAKDNALTTLLNLAKLYSINLHKNKLAALQSAGRLANIRDIQNVLLNLGIRSQAIRINTDSLRLIELPAVAYINKDEGYFVIINKYNTSLEYHDPKEGWCTSTLDEFATIWDGIILVIEKYDTNKKSIFIKNDNILKASIIIPILLFLIFFPSKINGLALIKITPIVFIQFFGLMISGLLLGIELNNDKAKGVCNIISNGKCAKPYAAFSLFNTLTMSDIGIIWFASNLLLATSCILYPSKIYAIMPVLSLISFFSLCFIPVSIYLQKIVKNWCSLCLLILSTLAINFLFVKSFFSFISKENSFLLVTVIFMIVTILWSLTKLLLNKISLYQQNELNTFFIKTEQDVFSFLMRNTNRIPHLLQDHNERNDCLKKLNLVIISDPFCKACKNLHKDLTYLIKLFEDEISVEYVMISQQDPIVGQEICLRLIGLSEKDKNIALTDWYSSFNYKNWIARYSENISDNHLNLFDEHQKWVLSNNIYTTPFVIINNKPLHSFYEIMDIIYHIDNI